MLAPRYTFKAWDPLTRQYLGRLQLDSGSFTRRVLPGPVGSLQGTISLDAAIASASSGIGYSTALAAIGAKPMALAQLSRLNRGILPGTLLVVESDGVPCWWGNITRTEYDSDTGSFTVYGSETFWYFDAYENRSDQAWTTRDSASVIFKGLIDWVQAQPNSNILVDTSTITPSGQTHTRTYVATDRKPIGEACKELGALDPGFQFLVDCVYDGHGSPVLSMRTGAPYLGGRYDAANPDATPRFTSRRSGTGGGATSLSYRWPFDILGYATILDTISHLPTGTVLVATAVNQALRDRGLLEMPYSIPYDGETQQSVLQQRANVQAAKRASLTGIPLVKVEPDAVLGVVSPGSDIRLLFEDALFPTPTEFVFRMLGYDVSCDQDTCALVLDVNGVAGI